MGGESRRPVEIPENGWLLNLFYASKLHYFVKQMD